MCVCSNSEDDILVQKESKEYCPQKFLNRVVLYRTITAVVTVFDYSLEIMGIWSHNRNCSGEVSFLPAISLSVFPSYWRTPHSYDYDIVPWPKARKVVLRNHKIAYFYE